MSSYVPPKGGYSPGFIGPLPTGGYINYAKAPISWNDPANGGTGNVLGAKTNTNTNSQSNSNPSSADFDRLGVAQGDVGGYNRVMQEQERLAGQQRDARLGAARDRLSILKQALEGQVGRARDAYGQIKGDIEGRFTDWGGQVEQGLERIKNALSEEDRGVTQNYDQLGMKIARTGQGAATRNAMLARAQGLGPSSAFQQTDGSIQRDMTDRNLVSEGERTAKLTGIKQRGSEAEADTVRMRNELGREKNRLLTEAENTLNQQIAQANVQEQLFGVDSAEAIETANNDYASKLSAIQDYVANQSAKTGGTLNTLGTGYTNDIASSYDPMGKGLGDTLAVNKTQGIADIPFSTAGTITSQGVPTNRALINPKREDEQSALDKFLYGVGLGGGGSSW